MRLFPRPSVLSDNDTDGGFSRVSAGARVVIYEVGFQKTFDSKYLVFLAELSFAGKTRSNVYINDLFDPEWLTDAGWAVDDGNMVDLDPENLPVRWKYVSICPADGIQGHDHVLPRKLRTFCAFHWSIGCIRIRSWRA